MVRKNLLKGLVKPYNVKLVKEEQDEHYGRFIATPFERGYATTIGNSLRRVLLSSLMGYAVSAIRVTCRNSELGDNVLSSEFETIPGMVEDTAVFLANLKMLDLVLENEEELHTVVINWQGEGQLTAALLSEHGVKVADPSVVLAHLMPDADFEIEFQIELGRGYRAAEDSRDLIEVVGTIPIDCLFSPVRRVAFNVEKTRVGERADYDKLTLEVWGNGILSPEDAVGEAAKVIKSSLEVFINFDESLVREEIQTDELDQKIKAFMATSIEHLELSVRSSNCLKSAGLHTVEQLLRSNEEEISKTKNFGKKSLQEIKDKLNIWGLELGISDYSSIRKSIKLEDWG